jgi:hypothetical protein
LFQGWGKKTGNSEKKVLGGRIPLASWGKAVLADVKERRKKGLAHSAIGSANRENS